MDVNMTSQRGTPSEAVKLPVMNTQTGKPETGEK